MAHPPMFSSDSFDGGAFDQSQNQHPAWPQDALESSVQHVASVLGQHGAGEAARDVALDLFLNEIVEQACIATRATGAAVALGHDGELICRATIGESAPDLGIRLHAGSGLSGLCIQTQLVQRCDDPAADPRVDAAVCHQLGVASVLVVPIVMDGDLVGIFEIFSSRPYAFGENDVRTLLAFSHRIANTIRALRKSDPVPAPLPPKVAAFLEPVMPADAVHQDIPEAPALFQTPAGGHGRDFWTPLLTATVITLALLLGWMLGRVGWQHARRTGAQDSGAPPATANAPTNAATGDSSSTPHSSLKTDNPAPTGATPNPSRLSSPVQSRLGASEDGGLVVYEGGKLVFQMKPSQPRSPVELAAERSASTGGFPQRPAADAMEHLLQRIEPHYPEQARLQHIQGTVVLLARVGKDGNVRKLQALSGDPQLVMAAADAVRQWRFNPYTPKGQPIEFETEIPVNFTLP